MTTTTRWQRVKQVFQRALDYEGEERHRFLNAECADDPLVREQAEALFAAHAQAGSFMLAPAAPSPSLTLPDRPHDEGFQTIGQYRIVKQLGEGGMGRVYLAVRADHAFRKQVAIKVIKRGMDTDAIVRRFRQERQAMASLDHPNIAKLLDGGTTDDGLPYFVMDYVEGLPIDDYCGRHKLTIEERLKLFQTVCSAVHHAHCNLIVHRDLKPDNILVTADGSPKLVDFGIAKVLNPGTVLQTLDLHDRAARCMTLDYASPEQVRGEPITTASDVYSLGVLLYELLTGQRPYQLKGRSLADVERTICECEPDKPSTVVTRARPVQAVGAEESNAVASRAIRRTAGAQVEKLRRRLAGDLDMIILMAMRKEPKRRYASVEQFAGDIERHLTGLPVLARTNTTVYRTSKFVRRHRAGVGMAATIVVLLLGGMVATAYQARVAEAERARAERRFNDVRRLANSLMFEVHDGIATLAGSTPVRQLVVKRALEYLGSLAQESAGSTALQRELGTAFQKIGDVQGYPYGANLGDSAGALNSYRRAAEIFQALVTADPGDNEARRGLAVCYERTVGVLLAAGDVGRALTTMRQAVDVYEALAAVAAVNRVDLASVYFRSAEALMFGGDWPAALRNYQKSLSLREALLADQPSNVDNRVRVSVTRSQIGWMLAKNGDPEGGMTHYRAALSLIEPTVAANPLHRAATRNLAAVHTGIGELLVDKGEKTSATQHHVKALALRKAVLKGDPKNAAASRDVAISYIYLAGALAGTDTANASSNLREGLRIIEALADGKPTRDLAIAYHLGTKVRLAEHDFGAAVDMARKGVSTGEIVAAQDPQDIYTRRELADAYAKLGAAHAMQGANPRARAKERAQHWRDAKQAYQRALQLLSELRSRGALIAPEAKELEGLPDQIARCDAALAKLEGQ
jgi:non-specific serine/threonine protein kinase/serine/threonine-protein kinase